ncbi:putative metal-binding motif-containing protein [Sandaracinus amylolyticus]|uniref:Uncharacterized protein n=1 Tax=Sandaracinus amylolyticus TaxID=927083 RepID=A0A0F6YHF4_9BACT|nr:putative metal-binding motif-containing protein [Sandaracinus amylolyticus]AKF05601.1 hypothetical protein DB32_002750 [Sandaracinus amylolyticus]
MSKVVIGSGLCVAMVLVACEPDYACGDFVWSEDQGRCVCPMGTTATDVGTCVLSDGGMIFPPGWDGAAPEACPDGRPMRELFEDGDGDGRGRAGSIALRCEGVPIGDDCDDACAECHPGAIEICDGRDNDCASGADDTFACVRGAATECETSCGSTGVAACGADCALPASATCTPPAEACDGDDDDCDGVVDEGVLAFGEPVDWIALAGNHFHVEPRADGLVAVWADHAGVHARLLDAAGAPAGVTVDLASTLDTDQLDTDVRGAVLYVAYSRGTEVYLLSAELPSLAVTAGPRRIATLATPTHGLQVEHTYTTMVFHDAASGSGVRMRSGTNIATDAFSERTAIALSTLDYEVVVPATSIDRTYVVYSGRASEAEDYEIYVQPVTSLGAEGTAHRITDNALHDDRPVVADEGDRLAIAWLQRATTGSGTSSLEVHSIVPTASSPWPAGDEVTIGTVDAFATHDIVPRAGGWLAIVAQRLSTTYSSSVALHPISRDARVAGAPLELESTTVRSLGIGRATVIGTTPWVPLGHATEGREPGFDARPIRCP